MRLPIRAVLFCSLALALPAAAQDFRAKIAEEVRLQHERAHELQQIAQSDDRMAQDLNNEATALIDHANRLDQKARDFRAMASQQFDPRQQQTLNKFAAECDNYARSDRGNVDFRRRVAGEMATSAQGAYAAAKQHEDHAIQMQQFLDRLNQNSGWNNGAGPGQPPPQNGWNNGAGQPPPPPPPQQGNWR